MKSVGVLFTGLVVLILACAMATRSLQQFVWSKQLTEGDLVPAARTGHALFAIGPSKLVLLGGRDLSDGWYANLIRVQLCHSNFRLFFQSRLKSKAFEDALTFDLDTLEWERSTAPSGFGARHGHCAATLPQVRLCFYSHVGLSLISCCKQGRRRGVWRTESRVSFHAAHKRSVFVQFRSGDQIPLVPIFCLMRDSRIASLGTDFYPREWTVAPSICLCDRTAQRQTA
jgi:hypothetical protein